MSQIPVLMYHAVAATPNAARFTLPVRQFWQQMRWLRESGWHLLSLEDVMRVIRGGTKATRGAVAVTFDDGHESFYHHARSVLAAMAIPAMRFVVAGKLGGTDDWMPPELPRCIVA